MRLAEIGLHPALAHPRPHPLYFLLLTHTWSDTPPIYPPCLAAQLNGFSLDSTPRTFDNVFFKELLSGSAPHVLESDRAMLTAGTESAYYVSHYADDSGVDNWRNTLVATFRKMGKLGQKLDKRRS